MVCFVFFTQDPKETLRYVLNHIGVGVWGNMLGENFSENVLFSFKMRSCYIAEQNFLLKK